jgi:hypothetical protein
MFPQVSWKLKLVQSVCHSAQWNAGSYVYRVLVSLHDCSEDFARINACFGDQTISNVEQQWKCHGHHLVEVPAHLAHLEAIHPAYCQQTLHAGEDGAGIVCAEQLDGDVEEVRPLCGKVVGEDFLEGGNELSAHLGSRGGEDGDQTVTERGLLLFRYGLRKSVVLGRRPSFRDAILEVDDS